MANPSLHWMVRTMLYYGNVCLDTETVLKFKERGIKSFFMEVFGVPVTVKEGPEIGAHRILEFNRTFIASQSYKDEMTVKRKFITNEDGFRDYMIKKFGVEEGYLPEGLSSNKKNKENF